MKINTLRKWVLGVLISLVAGHSIAQFQIEKFTINNAGNPSASAGDTYQLVGSVGQTDAGSKMSGGGFLLDGGFWEKQGNLPSELLFKDSFE